MRHQVFQFDDTKYAKLHATEDAYAIDGSTFCVADGITRDPLEFTDFTGYSWEELLQSYPNPSSAREAADVCAEEFIKSASLKSCNDRVAELNVGRKVDYLINDFAATVAAGGKIENDTLTWQSIGDCFIAVFDRSGQKKFVSPDGVAPWTNAEDSKHGDWNKPERRKLVRSHYRNNPDEPASYGALTGEKAAEHFIMSGEAELGAGDRVICYSDGFAGVVEHPDFFENLVDGRAFTKWTGDLAEQNYAKFGHERTLLIIKL